MSCVVCGGAGCFLCPVKVKELMHVHELHTPGNQALFDQEHAGALEKLRSAHTFVLAYVGEDGIGAVAANCREDVWMRAACLLASEAAENAGKAAA